MAEPRKKTNKGNKAVFPQVVQLSVASPRRFMCDVDRAKHVLSTHMHRVEERLKWQGPAGVAFTLVLTFVTTDFKNALGFSSVVWQSVAIIVLLSMLYLTFKYGVKSFKHRVSLSKLIDDLRNGIDE